ncbi:DNA-directed RNA polymerase subunit alpha C-terminal domain-containing protein [Nonomuraea purpurea]|uniref:DNA-directed RNA polymerase subunit alpha C-terminal domain-containing protein n=1 Tax=Nonomuraea purpurea TaxID=1849276 RepID=A0ABV8GKZ8_9ACTN
MNTTLPKDVQATVDATKRAHDGVTEAVKKNLKAVQERNLASLVFAKTHKQPVATANQLAGIQAMTFNEMVRDAPVPNMLPKMTLAAAEEMITTSAKAVTDTALEQDEARERRIRGILKLSHTEVDGKRLTNAKIARLTGLSPQLVGKDLKTAKERDYSPDDDIEAAEPKAVPAAAMAERLGTTVKQLMGRLDAARRQRIQIEGTSVNPGGRVMLFDVEAFPAWYRGHRLHWVTLAEFADSRGVSFHDFYSRLRTARAKGLEWETSDVLGGLTLNDPEAVAAWWDPVAKYEDAVLHGCDEHGRRNIAGMMALLGLSENQVDWTVRGWREEGDLPAHVIDERGSRWFEPLPFVAKLRGLDTDQLGQSPAALGLTARVVDALRENEIGTVEELLRRRPEDLAKLPGLGAASVKTIERKVSEAGWVFV